MPKSLIVYFSQGGTTAQVAESIASSLRTAEYQTDLCNMKDEQPPDVGSYDLLGIGSPTYYWRPPFNMMDYVDSLPDLDGLPAFVFLLHGTYRGDAVNPIRHTLARNGAREVGYFHCYGGDSGLPYRKAGYLFSPDHPTAEELVQAEAFGREVAAHVAGKPYARPEDDPFVPDMVYRLERFLTSRWLVRQLYSRLFRVDAKNCNACALCMKLCPTGNIAEGKGGRPVWGRNCLLCLTCEVSQRRHHLVNRLADLPPLGHLQRSQVRSRAITRSCAGDPQSWSHSAGLEMDI
jgi:flavodoxin/Pyruvate/2-oxoacid:ferredoxin oxidoreductase delta subunit